MKFCFALLLSFTIAPDAGADAVSDQEIEDAAAKHGADAGLMKRIRRCETPSGGPNAFQVKDYPGRPTDEKGKLDWAAQQVANGKARTHWVVCTGGGKAKGRSAPTVRTCVSHAEWQDVTWTVVTYRSTKCHLPEPPDWHATPRPSQGCGWTALETDPKWMCSLKLGPNQSISGRARIS